MKRKIKIVMLVLFIILSTVATIYLKSEAATYNDWNTYYKKMVEENPGKDIIIGKNGKVYNVSGNTTQTIPVQQYNDTAPGGDSNKKISILNQPNIWCVEKSKPIWETSYNISGDWILSEDKILTYILAHPQYPNETTNPLNLKTTYNTPTQIALWKYLSDTDVKSNDKTNLLSGIGVVDVDTSNSNANKLYTNAKNYANAINNLEGNLNINDFKYNYEGKNLVVSLKQEISRLSRFKVILYNGNTKVGEYNSNNNKEVSVNVSNIGNNGETIKIQIEVRYNTFQTWYKILKNPNNSRQRLIVSKFGTEYKTELLDGNLTFNKPEYAISLEKYITEVKSGVDNSSIKFNEESNSRAGKRYNIDAKILNENGEEIDDLQNKNEYKFIHPIEAEVGDTIEYTIKVSNTGKNAIKLTEITDNPNKDILEFVKIDSDNWNYNQDNGLITPKTDYTCTLNKAQSIEIKIYFKVKKESSNKIENVARVTGIDNSEVGANDTDGPNNNADADYIKVVSYSVSFQKYISKVNDTTIYDTKFDMNNDGIVDKIDVTYIQRLLSGIDRINANGSKLDINGDNFIDIEDAKVLNKWIKENNNYDSKYDMNNDGIVDDDDYIYIQKVISSGKILDIDNKDGISIKDATALEKWAYENTRLGDEVNYCKRLNYNNYINGKEEHVSLYKAQNPVEVEMGNTVTYTLKIKNTGSESIVVTKIYDKPGENLTEGIMLTNIEYASRGFAGDYIIDSITSNNGRYIITFKNPTSILPGKEVYIDVKLTVSHNLNYDGVLENSLLRNEAGIVTITNSQGKSVKDSDGDDNNHDCDIITIKKYAVSLEKYITKVTDKNGKNEEKYENRAGKRHNESLNNGDTNKNVYKINNPVYLENGDRVTFKIKLTNRGNAKVKITEINDIFTNNTGVKLKFISITDGEYKSNKITFTDDAAKLIDVSSSLTIEMLFEVQIAQSLTNISQTLENKAEIINIKNKYNITVTDSDGEPNNADKDVLKTKVYAVSLEKFITKVTDANGNNVVLYSGREGKRYNDDKNLNPIVTTDSNEDKITRHSYKNGNRVSVEPGDIVTYTIRLKNTIQSTDATNKETKIKVAQIYDSYTNITEEGHASKGIKLEPVRDQAKNIIITYADNAETRIGATITENYSSASTLVTRYLVTFDNPIELEPGVPKDIQVKFKVTVPSGITNVQQDFQNKAGIVTIKNDRNNIDVEDYDGEANNFDKDWVKTKLYKVSLEKYIEGVASTGKSGTNLITNTNSTLYNCPSADRSGKRYNDKANNKTNASNYNKYKINNPVQVEKGDTVTYEILLKNEGNTLVKFNKIYDLFANKGLQYDATYGVKKVIGNNEVNAGFIENSSLNRENNANITEYVINFNEPIVLANKDDEIIIKIKFKVISSAVEDSVYSNMATIDVGSLTNRNNENVLDGDGTDNNTDQDDIKLKKYSVSLEKYIVGVESTGKVDSKLNTNINSELYNCPSEDRSDKRHNEDLSNGHSEKNKYKADNKVAVEPGDIVTYKIMLKNTSSTTAVKVTEISDRFRFVAAGDNAGLQLVYDSAYGIKGNGDGSVINAHYKEAGNSDKEIDRYLIRFNNAILLAPEGQTEVTMKFKVIVPANLTTKDLELENKAKIVKLENRNSANNNQIEVKDSDGEANNADMDWVKPKKYAVSLKKIVHSVNNDTDNITSDFKGSRWNSWESSQIGNLDKYNNPVTLKKGDTVTYAIQVINDNQTNVKDIVIKDSIPNGLDFSSITIEKVTKKDARGKETIISNALSELNKNEDKRTVQFKLNAVLNPTNDTKNIYIYISATVTEPNISVNVLRNYAEITGTWQERTGPYMKNRNGEVIKDSTEGDNQDADYIQMKDIIISGIVWNDKAFDKTQNYYNGKIDSNEGKLGGITVKLYRDNGENVTEVVTDKPIRTDSNGNYTFALNYIKGPRTNGRWSGAYYKYYVVFEYDGVTYTSTELADNSNDTWLGIKNTDHSDSNAKEDNSNAIKDLNSKEAKNLKLRTEFNNNFNVINNASGINYTTVNEEEYIPQSIHNEKDSAGNLLEKYKMQSSTNKIELERDENLEEQIKHINLGLRGRDIFDLELTSDVHEIKVTVNEQVGVYNYSNKVSLRKEDLNKDSFTTEDMANIEKETSNIYVDSQEQKIRDKDLNVDTENTKYESEQGVQNIEVTYKLTVHNASRTAGKVTKIRNYYDSRYEFIGAYTKSDQDERSKRTIDTTLSKEPSENDLYGYKTINMPDITLGQSASIDIFVVYKLKAPKDTLSNLTEDNSIPTFNMSEIIEYKTVATNKNGITDEATRGLIDKDSAPGSANKEQVRTTETVGQNTATTGGKPTTVEYYFGGNDLSKLKYEDDTYATPTLYFVYDNSLRTITGTVFRDNTETDSTTKIKTGNGKIDEGEVGVYGATVQLIELVKEGEETVGRERILTTTQKDGSFKIEGFLPGNYIIRYYYGDTRNTVLLRQSEDVNIYSFNGEDYQATNNKYEIDGMDTNILNTTERFWYVYNQKEGISTATDNVTRRNEVSSNVIGESSDEIMKRLNAARAGQTIEDSKLEDLIQKTYMIADTSTMLLEVEPVELLDEKLDQRKNFGEYIVSNMNFGIAEVPVTTIDLQKEVESFTITDATGTNTIIKASKDDSGIWVTEGNVIQLPEQSGFDVSIEDEKLQGARLQVTYGIKSDITIERNYDKKDGVKATIAELSDIIDNNLSYNAELNGNSVYWTENSGTIEKSSIDNITTYKVIVNANNRAIDKINKGEEVYITLEKVLSSTDSTLAEIITSVVDIYEYNNIIEITEFHYDNVTSEDPDGRVPENPVEPMVQKDRIRTPDRYIIIPGIQHDTASAETITIHPPTGASGIDTVYYILAVISLAVISIGVFGIKKFVLNSKK